MHKQEASIIGYIFLLLFYLSLPQIKLLKKIIIISLFISIPLGLFNFIDIKKIGEHRVDQNRMKTTIENLFNSNDIQSNSIENKNLLNNKKNMNIVFHQEGLRSGKSP